MLIHFIIKNTHFEFLFDILYGWLVGLLLFCENSSRRARQMSDLGTLGQIIYHIISCLYIYS